MIFKYTVLKKYNIILVILVTSILSVCLFSSFNIPKTDPVRKVKTIVIDPGHGGKDPGCNGVSHTEKEVALAVALKLGKLIEENIKDVKVIYTRKTDVFVELEDRAEIANDNNADLFISIHCNAAGKPVMIKDKKTGKMRKKTFKNSRGKLVVVETSNPVPYGSETYVMGLKNEEGKMKVAQRENSAMLLEDNYEKKYGGFDPNSEESYIIMSNYTSGYVIQSAGLALKIQEEYSKKAGRVDKGVHRQSIWVLWRTAMPSILTEIGYLTNPQEEKFLGSDKGQNYMASCLFRAFRKYKDEQEGSKKEYDDMIEKQEALEKEVYITPKDTVTENVEEEKNVVREKEIADSLTKVNSENKEKMELNKTQQNKYKQLISLADLNFKNKKYDLATTNYTEALKVFKTLDPQSSDSNYAERKLASIDSIVTQQKHEKELKESIKQATKADSLATKNSHIENKNSTATIVFKVQFATHDKEINASNKYPNISDVSFYKVGATFKYTSGNYVSFDEATKQQFKLKELGYKDCFVAGFKNGNRIDISEAKKLAEQK